MKAWLYALLLRCFPMRSYAGRGDWQWFVRFDIAKNDAALAQGDIYLRRFILLKTPLFGLYLHHILRSDADRCLHDHPWDFWTLMLRGGYYEETPAEATLFTQRLMDGATQAGLRPEGIVVVRKWYGPGSLRFIPAHWCHRVLLSRRDPFDETFLPEGEGAERPAWTLVLVSPKRRTWGFWGPSGWIGWREFIAGNREC